LFFSQKIAESQGKYYELSADLTKFKEMQEEQARQATTGGTQRGILRLRFGQQASKGAPQSAKKFEKEQSKTAQQLKLAFSEFYLNLVLLQNYQQLNSKGFTKILKKHDKLLENAMGMDWRINRVEKSSFYMVGAI